MRPIKIAPIATVDLSLRYLLLNQLHSLLAAGYQESLQPKSPHH